MPNPITVTIDLASLGMEYDHEGDPIGRKTFQDAVIEAAAAKLLADSAETKLALRERVQKLRDEELRAALAIEVRQAMSLPIQRTSEWGEAKGAPVTILELVRLEMQAFLSAKPRGTGYRSSDDRTPRNLEEMVKAVVAEAMRQEFAPDIKKAREAVSREVTSIAVAAAQKLLAK